MATEKDRSAEDKDLHRRTPLLGARESRLLISLPPQHQRYGGPKIMDSARRRAVPIQFKMVLGSRLQSEDAKAAKHAETLGRSGCLRAAHRNPGQSPAFATMLARRLALGWRRYWRLRHVKENKRLVPHQPRRHDRDVSALREQRRLGRPRFERNLAALGAERDAKCRGRGLSPANALPKSEWTDDFRL